MSGEIKMFFAGVLTGICAFIAYVLGRKKNTSDGSRVRCDNDPVTECLDTVERIQKRTESRLDETERGLQESIGILQRARERSEKEDDSL